MVDFVGTYYPRLDEKGRLALPAKWREDLMEGLVLCKGQERTIAVFTPAEFARYSAPFEDPPVHDKPARDFARVLFSGAYEEQPDRQGRVTIPPELRSYARLDRDCAVTGVRRKLEIWDAARWYAQLGESEDKFATGALQPRQEAG